MFRVEIDLVHPDTPSAPLRLSWALLEHEAATVWFGLLVELLRGDIPCEVRYTGFLTGPKDQEFLLNRLSRSIQVINEDGRYFIPEKPVSFSQDFSNAIHHHFEVLIGSRDKPTRYYLESSPTVVQAVRDLNCLIHDLEAFDRNSRARSESLRTGSPDTSFAGITLESILSRRLRIPSRWYDLFTPNIAFGDLVCHYSQIGKTWLEVFYDRDTDIFDEAIQPHYALAGTFDVMFGELDFDSTLRPEFESFIRSRGLDPRDPELRVGHLPLGKLERTDALSNTTFKDQVGEHAMLHTIRAIASGRVVAERTLGFESSDLATYQKY